MPSPDTFYTWVDGNLQSSIQREGPLALDSVTIDLIDRTIMAALRDLIPKEALVAADKARATDFFDGLPDGDDKDRVAEAVGLLAASRLIGPLSTGGANGQLLSEKTETVSRTFAAGPGSKEEWEARAWMLVDECGFETPSGLVANALVDAVGSSRTFPHRHDGPWPWSERLW